MPHDIASRTLDRAIAAHRYASSLLAAVPDALPYRVLRIADMAAEQLQIACRLLAAIEAAR